MLLKSFQKTYSILTQFHHKLLCYTIFCYTIPWLPGLTTMYLLDYGYYRLTINIYIRVCWDIAALGQILIKLTKCEIFQKKSFRNLEI